MFILSRPWSVISDQTSSISNILLGMLQLCLRKNEVYVCVYIYIWQSIMFQCQDQAFHCKCETISKFKI